jgi:malate synthase
VAKAQLQRVEIRGAVEDRYEEVLTDGALELLGRLHRELDGTRRELLRAREERQTELDAWGTLDLVAGPGYKADAPGGGELKKKRRRRTKKKDSRGWRGQ